MSRCAYCETPLANTKRRDAVYCDGICRAAASRDRGPGSAQRRTHGATQAERMLLALRNAGADGVHTFTARRDLYIGNPSQRIAELTARGYTITATRERLHGHAVGSRYRLTAGPSRLPVADPTMLKPETDASLFGSNVARPSIYSPYSDAA